MKELTKEETENMLEILTLNKKLLNCVNSKEEYAQIVEEIQTIENYFNSTDHEEKFIVAEPAEGFYGLLCLGCGNYVAIRKKDDEVIEDDRL